MAGVGDLRLPDGLTLARGTAPRFLGSVTPDASVASCAVGAVRSAWPNWDPDPAGCWGHLQRHGCRAGCIDSFSRPRMRSGSKYVDQQLNWHSPRGACANGRRALKTSPTTTP